MFISPLIFENSIKDSVDIMYYMGFLYLKIYF